MTSTEFLNAQGIARDTDFCLYARGFDNPTEFFQAWAEELEDKSNNILDEGKDITATGYCYAPDYNVTEYYYTIMIGSK